MGRPRKHTFLGARVVYDRAGSRWGPGRPTPHLVNRCVESLQRRASRRRRGQLSSRHAGRTALMHRLALQERPVAAAHLLASSLGSWPPRPTRRKPVRGEPAAPHIAAPPWAAGRQDALDEHRGTSRATSDSLCQLYGAAALPDHPGRPPREAGHPPASTQGWSSACVSGWASRTRWTSTSCIDASYSLCITRAAALPDHPSRPLSCEARSPV